MYCRFANQKRSGHIKRLMFFFCFFFSSEFQVCKKEADKQKEGEVLPLSRVELLFVGCGKCNKGEGSKKLSGIKVLIRVKHFTV